MCCHEAKKAVTGSPPGHCHRGSRNLSWVPGGLGDHVKLSTLPVYMCMGIHLELFGVLIKALKNIVLGWVSSAKCCWEEASHNTWQGACLGVGVTWECFQGPECGGSLIPAVVPRGGLRKSALCVRRGLLGEFIRPQPLHGPLAGLGSQLAPWRLTKFRVSVYQRCRCSAREVEHCRTSDMAGRGDHSHESCPGNCSFSQPPSRADSPGPNPPGTLI